MIATPSMYTLLLLELVTRIFSVPERADVKVVTVMSFLFTVFDEWRLMLCKQGVDGGLSFDTGNPPLTAY